MIEGPRKYLLGGIYLPFFDNQLNNTSQSNIRKIIPQIYRFNHQYLALELLFLLYSTNMGKMEVNFANQKYFFTKKSNFYKIWNDLLLEHY